MKKYFAALVLGLLIQTSVPAEVGAFAPANPPEMKPLANHDSPAYRAVKQFRRGINLGDYLEAPPRSFGHGVTCEAGEFALMRSEGFDHVRVPIGWHHYAGPAPEFKLSPEIFSRVDFIVTNALASGLAVMINIHHFNELDRDPAANADEFVTLWRQIAEHYTTFPALLAFELDNEPHERATTAAMNPIYGRAIAEIRKTNPRRALFIEPGNWGGIDELKNLVLPDDDNLIVSAHCYEPFHFTHQGAGWAGPDVKVKGIQFPGPPKQPLAPDPALGLRPSVLDWVRRYNTLPPEQNPSGPAAFEGKLKYAADWSAHYGRPVHIGEFGCFTAADPESRARFLAAFRRTLDQNQLPWAMWDWSANFRYWDKRKNQPMPGVREALFGK